MIRFLSIFIVSALGGGSSLLACSCVHPLNAGPCGNLAGTPVRGSITFVGTATSAEHAGILGRGATDLSPLSYYHFHVDEMIAGIGELSKVDIVSTRGGGDCSAHFEVGEQYLIHAYQKEDGSWSTSICAGNRLASEAALFLEQVRAQRKGEKIPSLYGYLRRVEQPYESVRNPEYERGLAAVPIRIGAGDFSLETITDANGQYRFYDVPKGKYAIAADLPTGLALAQTILRDPPPAVDIPQGACIEYAITALPKTRITGHVLSDSGRPVDLASVTLYREELYGKEKGSFGWRELQQASKPFVFDRVAPGSYIVVFNESNDLDPDAPFGRTFYGDAHDVAQATRLIVSEEDSVITADIHLSGGRETRKITVRVRGEDGQPYESAYLTLQPRSGFPLQQGEGAYTINLFKGTPYEITANSYCLLGSGKLSNAKVSARVADDATEVALVMPGEPCPNKQAPAAVR